MIKKRIRVVYNYGTGDSLCQLWDKMTDGNYSFTKEGKTLELVGEGLSCEDADYVVVVNGGVTPDRCLFNKTIFCKMEPVFVDKKWEDVGSWSLFGVFGLRIDQNISSPNALEWHLNKTRSVLLDPNVCPKKTKGNIISAVISGKQQSPGHVARIRFVLFAQQFLQWDVYGNAGSHKLPWNTFLGSPEYKDIALTPYRYSFACENHFIDDYVTEKLVDCILAETLCFYDGAPNVESIIDSRAFIKIDLKDHVSALETIKSSIDNNEYEKRLFFIKTEKERIVNTTSVIPRLWRLIFENKKEV